jgi:hypothetical protein
MTDQDHDQGTAGPRRRRVADYSTPVEVLDGAHAWGRHLAERAPDAIPDAAAREVLAFIDGPSKSSRALDGMPGTGPRPRWRRRGR